MEEINQIPTSLGDRMGQYINEIEYSKMRMQSIIGIPQKLIGVSVNSATMNSSDSMYQAAIDSARKNMERAVVTLGNKFMRLYISREQKTLRGYRLPRKLKKKIKKLSPGKMKRSELKFHAEVFKYVKYYGCKIIKERV